MKKRWMGAAAFTAAVGMVAHNAHGSSLTWMIDHQNYGSGGGSYRIVTGGWYDSLGTWCSGVGLL